MINTYVHVQYKYIWAYIFQFWLFVYFPPRMCTLFQCMKNYYILNFCRENQVLYM